MAFAEDWRETILFRLTEGESLRRICRDEDMPGRTFVFSELANDPEFANQYARAREAQADAIFDDILDIVDDTTEMVDDRRIRMDARKWIAGKLRPKVYGDKLELSGDPERPLAIIERRIVKAGD
jgi:hypothetical protein